ncbi:MAG: NCS2 family permease [Firmicutes bacterium]|nr:NCS2 family permease [Bacillota bacterium]
MAGLTTFMTMAYILFVNPDILSAAGMPFGPVMTATALSAGVTTILMGLVTNYPFALASGMGLNAMFAFAVAPIAGWQAALGVVFISGILFFILAVLGVIDHIDAAIPASLKRATAAGIGLFIAFIGLQNAGIIVGDEATIVTLGNLRQPETLLAIIGLLIMAVLMAKKVRGSILLGILLTTVVSFFMGIQPFPSRLGHIFGAPASLAPIAFQIDFAGAFRLGFMTIFAFAFVDIFDTLGTLMGTGARAGFLDKNGLLPQIKEAMIVDAVGTVLGAAVGTSTVTTYVESTAGVSEGGRSGLTAVTVGVLFLASLFLAPLAGLVPSGATAPALIIVGVMMMGAVTGIDFADFTEALPAFLTMLFMPMAYSIAHGIAAGFLSYPIVKLVAGRKKEVHWFTYILALISLIHFAL